MVDRMSLEQMALWHDRRAEYFSGPLVWNKVGAKYYAAEHRAMAAVIRQVIAERVQVESENEACAKIADEFEKAAKDTGDLAASYSGDPGMVEKLARERESVASAIAASIRERRVTWGGRPAPAMV